MSHFFFFFLLLFNIYINFISETHIFADSQITIESFICVWKRTNEENVIKIIRMCLYVCACVCVFVFVGINQFRLLQKKKRKIGKKTHRKIITIYDKKYFCFIFIWFFIIFTCISLQSRIGELIWDIIGVKMYITR